MHTDLLVKTCLGGNSVIPLRLPSCRVWAGSTHLLSLPHAPGRHGASADQLHQHAHSPLSPAQASSTLPGLGCSSVSQQDRSKGCSWFSASLMSGSQKGLSKARAGSVAAGGSWGALVLKEGRWGSRDAFAWLSWPGKHHASTR